MSERYFVDAPLQPGPVELHGPEAHHLAHVSRLRRGDELRLFNGDGCEYPARVIDVARRAVALEVLDVCRPQRELPFRLEVAASIPRGDRGQFLIEKLTELGVTTFIPLLCQRSNTHPRELRPDKLQRHVIEASKQCGRNVLMEIGAAADWDGYCRTARPATMSILAHPGGTADTSGREFQQTRRDRPDVRVAVGPEGGLTGDEVETARNAEWFVIDLGPRILRVETAALALAWLAVWTA